MRPCSKKMAMSANGTHSSEYTKQDILSSLPDTLLIAILSLLPIDSAAATSVLSHRWRHLWTHVTHLSFAPPWRITFDNLEHFMTFINHILSQLTSSKIHIFHLCFPHHLPYNEIQANGSCLAFLVPWIHLICRRNPEVIKIISEDVIPVRLFYLPTYFFNSQSLVILELDMNIEFKFPGEVINLPNLKKLHMFLYDSHRRLMEKLFKSCPLLEDLYLSLLLREKNHLVDISAQHLECLHINMKGSLSNDCKFVIDAPKLEQFEIEGILAIYDFIEDPSCLKEVRVSLEMNSFSNDKDHLSERLGLFQGISCVRSLILHDRCILMLDCLVGFTLPIFDNLVHLSLTCGDDLESDDIGWSPQIPSCLLGRLKKIDVFEMLGNHQFVQEMKLLKEILSNATVLELLHVSLFKHVEDVIGAQRYQLWNEYTFCKELFAFSRSSLSCLIEFSGNMINASSNDSSVFSNGALTCRIIE